MGHVWDVLKIALRAAVWQRTPDPPAVGLATLAVWCAINLACAVFVQYVAADEVVRFNIYGLNAQIAVISVGLLAASFFVRPKMRATALAALLALLTLDNLVFEFLPNVAGLLVGTPTRAGLANNLEIFAAVVALYLAWYFGAIVAILRSASADPQEPQLRRALGVVAATLIATALVPHYPTIIGRDFDRQNANWWEYFAGSPQFSADQPDRGARVTEFARVELAQPALLDAAVASLAPQRSGITDIYTIGVAGWAHQDVFIKELDGALRAMSRSLPIEQRVLRLVNHRDTLAATPLATRQNFAAAVKAVSRVMAREEDILLLFLTSHGSRDGIALQFDGAVHSGLTPEHVAMVLDENGIKNRMVIVSGCYAGVFVRPLANDNAMVLAASDENSTSFGCSDERTWTYFGEALFYHSLQPGRRIEDAFADAKELIAQWEKRENMKPSNPQAHFGRALMAKLAPLYLWRNAAAPIVEETRQADGAARRNP